MAEVPAAAATIAATIHARVELTPKIPATM
jgi:hypothetical protein